MQKLDLAITKTIQKAGSSTMDFWWNIARFGLYGYAVAVLGVTYFITEKHRVAFILLPVGVVLVLTLVIQMLVRRQRPKRTKTTYDLWVPTFSFPSAHSSVSFAFASSLSVLFLNSHLEYSWMYAVVFFVLAILIALSRIIVGVHYFGDVFVGALLGILISVSLLTL